MTGVNMDSVLLFFFIQWLLCHSSDPVKATSYGSRFRACTAFRCRRFAMASPTDSIDAARTHSTCASTRCTVRGHWVKAECRVFYVMPTPHSGKDSCFLNTLRMQKHREAWNPLYSCRPRLQSALLRPTLERFPCCRAEGAPEDWSDHTCCSTTEFFLTLGVLQGHVCIRGRRRLRLCQPRRQPRPPHHCPRPRGLWLCLVGPLSSSNTKPDYPFP